MSMEAANADIVLSEVKTTVSKKRKNSSWLRKT